MERDELVADAAISYLRERVGSDKPFILGASLTNPHDICYWVMNHDVRATVESDSPLPPLPDNWAIDPDEPEFVGLCRRREHYGQENTYTLDWDQARWRAYLHHYYRFVEQVDGCIGRILSALRELGLEGATLVCLTTDHGEGCAAHQWVVKLMFWENVVNVPLIFRWPGRIPAGATREQLASGTDVMPTFCDIAGARIPEGVTGLSLREVLAQADAPLRDHLICELQPDTERPELLGRMVRTERIKYAAYSLGDRPEALFDMVDDPGETHNLANDPRWAEELERHRQLLVDWIAAAGDRFVPPWR
jgi:arylsulfatase A-like enzyme